MRRALAICALLAACTAGPHTQPVPPGDTTIVLGPADTVAPTPEAQRGQERLYRTTGTLEGRITDAETGGAVESAHVSTHTMGGFTGEDGRYRVIYIDPREDAVEVSAPGFRPVSLSHRFVAGRVDTLDVPLRHAEPVRLRLAGRWATRFQLVEPGFSIPGGRWSRGRSRSTTH
jgi:hypothetical protein